MMQLFGRLTGRRLRRFRDSEILNLPESRRAGRVLDPPSVELTITDEKSLKDQTHLESLSVIAQQSAHLGATQLDLNFYSLVLYRVRHASPPSR